MDYVLCVWGSLEPEQKCQKPIILHYWYGAWRRMMSRQAVVIQNSSSGHWISVAPGGSKMVEFLEVRGTLQHEVLARRPGAQVHLATK